MARSPGEDDTHACQHAPLFENVRVAYAACEYLDKDLAATRLF